MSYRRKLADLSVSRCVGSAEKRVENDDRLVQIPDKDATQVRLGEVGRRVRLAAGAVAGTTR